MEKASLPVSLAALHQEQLNLMARAWPYVLGYVLFVSVPFIYLDLYHWDAEIAYVWIGFLTWALGYLLILKLLSARGLIHSRERGGVGTYVALAIPISLAVGLALVVFILPGIYLLMRWLPVFARALTRREWIGTSMRWSWNATEKFQRPLAISLAGPVALYLVAFGFPYLFEYSDWTTYTIIVLVTNLSAALGQTWLSVLGVASFALLLKVEGAAAK